MSSEHPGTNPISPEARPLAIDLDLARQELNIRWADGVVSVYPLAMLRKNCPCASCKTEREKQSNNALHILSDAQNQAAQATVTGGTLVGNYAVQLTWSDGHNTGIFDFRLLRAMHDGCGH